MWEQAKTLIVIDHDNTTVLALGNRQSRQPQQTVSDRCCHILNLRQGLCKSRAVQVFESDHRMGVSGTMSSLHRQLMSTQSYLQPCQCLMLVCHSHVQASQCDH